MRYRRLQIPGSTVFLTLVVDERRPIFENQSLVLLLERAIDKMRGRHPFESDAHVILPDHVHMMWTLPEGDSDYPTRVRLLKEAFTRAYLFRYPAPKQSASRRKKSEQAVWQRRYWEHTIRDEDDFFTHLDYVHLNPVHHGLARAPGSWPYSSFQSWVDREVYEAHWWSDASPGLPDWAKKCE